MAAEEGEAELPPQTLSEPLMELSGLGRTVDGTGYVYQEVACAGKRINMIKAIEAYVHVQLLDFSANLIKDIAPLRGLQYLVRLNLSQNAIVSLKGLEKVGEEGEEGEPPLPHLQHLDLSGNALTALAPLKLQALRTLSLARNQITSCQDFTGHERLEALDLSGNQLQSLAGVAGMPALAKLGVASNQLSSIEGLTEVPALKELDLSANKLKGLEGPWQDFPELSSLDLSANELQAIQSFEALRQLPKLRSLDARENPCVLEAAEAGPPVLAQLLVCHWRLSTVNGAAVADGDLERARELNVSRMLEERERIKAEQDAATAGEGGED